MNARAMLAPLVLAMAACGDPLVGGDCLPGYHLDGARCALDETTSGAGGWGDPVTTGSALDCGTLTACDGACFDLVNDPFHCGSCDRVCDGGACVAGECAGLPAGHVAVLGVDVGSAELGSPAARLVGNALALATHEPVRVAELATLTRTKPVEHERLVARAELEARGRAMTLSVVEQPSALAAALAARDVDVLMISPASPPNGWSMSALGAELAPALSTFLGKGGVLVAWTTPEHGDDVARFLGVARALDATSTAAADGDLEIADWLDALAVGEGSPFTASGGHTSFALASPLPPSTSIVVVSDGGAPVVIHRAFAPESP